MRESYKEMVGRLSRENSDELIACGTSEHAKVFLTELFNKADRVRIFPSQQDLEILASSDVIGVMDNFLTRDDTQIDLLFRKGMPETDEGRALLGVFSQHAGQCNVRVADQAASNYPESFAVAEKRALPTNTVVIDAGNGLPTEVVMAFER